MTFSSVLAFWGAQAGMSVKTMARATRMYSARFMSILLD
jgi:hypothetical protein